MENKKNIAAIIVTYNRGNLLIRCLKAIISQSLLPNEIFVIDNHSDDNTQQLLIENKFCDDPFNGSSEFGKTKYSTLKLPGGEIKVTYLYKDENDGGAGGFYAGMKVAYDTGYEWLWMMDDDGVPEERELSELYIKSNKYNLLYSNALVINEKNSAELSFGLGLDSGRATAIHQKQEIIYDVINPFNGTFINRRVIDKIGLIKKELFIWGDEVEYTTRVKHNGFKIGTVTSAEHFHPAKYSKLKNIIPFIPRFKFSEIKDIQIRNLSYIYWNYDKHKFFKWAFSYVVAYAVRLNLKRVCKFFKYSRRGITENWGKF